MYRIRKVTYTERSNFVKEVHTKKECAHAHPFLSELKGSIYMT